MPVAIPQPQVLTTKNVSWVGWEEAELPEVESLCSHCTSLMLHLALFSGTQRTALFLSVDTGHSSLPVSLCPILEPSLGIQEKQRDDSRTPNPKAVKLQVLGRSGTPQSWP